MYTYIVVMELLYSKELSREKLENFTVLWLFVKVFSAKFGSVTSFGVANASNIRKFSPRNFPAIRYTVKFLNNRANILLAVTCFDFVKCLLVQG